MNLQQLIAKVLYLDRKLTTLKISGVGSAPTWGAVTGTLANQTDLNNALATKQATLVSGTNIKTINSTSLLGSGDVAITGTLPAGSVVAGSALTLPGTTAITGGNTLVGGTPTSVIETSQADFATGTLVNTQSNSNGTLTLLDAANGTKKDVSFDGDRANQISVPHNTAYNLTGDLTIEAWAYLVNPTAFSPIISKGDSGGTFDLVVQSGGGVNPNNYGWIRFGQGGSYTTTEAVGALRLNQWHHVAVTKTGTTVQFYLNGVALGTRTFAPSVPTNASSIYIGHATDSFLTAGYLFRGALFDVRLWNVARTASEIANNMNTLTPSGSGLVGHWKMQEGSGTSIADSSATANNGTLAGTDYAWQTLTSNYATSGTRVSPVYDISSAKTISTSAISWNAITPTGTTITIESRYSTDGGSNYSAYATCTNGSPIPGLSSTTDLSNGRIQFRQTLTTPSANLSPILSDLTATFTTPAYQYNLGVRTASPTASLDAGVNTIQGKLLDTGGAVINITSPRYGNVDPTGVSPCDDAMALALADIGPARNYNTSSTGKIVFPKGTFYFANDLELNRPIILEGAGAVGTGTTLSFADGKGVKIPAGEVFGGYGTDQGAGSGTELRDILITSRGVTNVPTATVNVSGLSITKTAGAAFKYERWGGSQVVKIGNTYACIANWLSATTATLQPLRYSGTVSGNTVTLQYGHDFPVGLTNVAVKIDGVSYNLHATTASTASVLTLSSSPAETGDRTIEIQSLGTLTGQTMSIYVNHGVEASGVCNLHNVTITGFGGNGLDYNTLNYSYDNARNCNTFLVHKVLSINNYGHGIQVSGFNANASSLIGFNGFANKGWGILDECSYGNTYIGPHTDSNKMGAVNIGNATPVIGLYSEGNQPKSKFKRASGVGVTGAVVIGGFSGAGVTYDSDSLIISDTGNITGVSSLTALAGGGGIKTGADVTMQVNGETTGKINFGYGVAGQTQSGAIHVNGGALNLFSNTYSSGAVPTNTSSPSWWNLLSSGGDYVRWYRAPATSGSPSFVQLAELDGNGKFTAQNFAWAGANSITKILAGEFTLNFPSIAANSTSDLEVTLTGVTDRDKVIATPRSNTPEAGLVWSAYVSGADKVKVRMANVTTGAIDPANSDWEIVVIRTA